MMSWTQLVLVAVFLLASSVIYTHAIKCYYGDSLHGRTEKDCEKASYCRNITDKGDSITWSCDNGSGQKCKDVGCTKDSFGATVCCCDTDLCNYDGPPETTVAPSVKKCYNHDPTANIGPSEHTCENRGSLDKVFCLTFTGTVLASAPAAVLGGGGAKPKPVQGEIRRCSGRDFPCTSNGCQEPYKETHDQMGSSVTYTGKLCCCDKDLCNDYNGGPPPTETATKSGGKDGTNGEEKTASVGVGVTSGGKMKAVAVGIGAMMVASRLLF